MAKAISFRKFIKENSVAWPKDGHATEYTNGSTGEPFHVFKLLVNGEHEELSSTPNVGDIPDIKTLIKRVEEDDLQVLLPEGQYNRYCLCFPGNVLREEDSATSEELFGDLFE